MVQNDLSIDKSKILAYVDGSYISEKVGYGAVILCDGKKIMEFCGPVSAEFAQGSRQVAGELFAVGKVIRWCEQNEIPRISIYYDYYGIEYWAIGKWKAKKNITQRYKKMMLETRVQVIWHKVKSHDGNYWNEVADELAKQGALSG